MADKNIVQLAVFFQEIFRYTIRCGGKQMKTILTIGGSDPFAGGGIQSDLKTFENYHHFGVSALTSIGMLNNEGDFVLQTIAPEWLEQQLVSISQ